MTSPAELERLYDQHAPAIFGFLLNLTHSEADTRDLLQEVFVKLARRADVPGDIRNERAFLLRLANNLTIDFFRRSGARKRHQAQAAKEDFCLFAPSDEPDQAAFRQHLAAALRLLPAGQRAVIHLKLWEKLTFEDIANTLGISLNTAASRYRYGIDKLRAQLRPLYTEIQPPH